MHFLRRLPASLAGVLITGTLALAATSNYYWDPNLGAIKLSSLFASPPAIGGTTPAAGHFTTLSASSTVSGAGVTALFAAPPAIGGTTPAAGAFTTLDATTLGSITPPNATVSAFHLDTGTKTATASSGAATLNKMAGVITSEALTTAAGATYTLTLTNSDIAATDQVFASVALGTATTGMPTVTTVKPGTGSVVIVIQNIHATDPLNGTIKIAFATLKN